MSACSSYQQKVFFYRILLFAILLSVVGYVLFTKKNMASFEVFIIVTTILVLVVFSLLDNNIAVELLALEHFSEEQGDKLTSSAVPVLPHREYTNEKYQDTMIDKTLHTHLASKDVVGYFSTLQFDSFDFSKKHLRSLTQAQADTNTLKFNQYSKDKDTANYLKIADEDSIIEYAQRDGINLRNNVEVVGFPLADLQNAFMKNFSISLFLKLSPFDDDDYDSSFTLFEAYSSNVMNSIALGIYLEASKTSTDKVLNVKINYAGTLIAKILPISIVDRVFQGCHLITFEKSISAENNHYVRLLLDDGSDMDLLPLTQLNLSEIKYVTSSRQHVVLSTEPFVINKQSSFRSLNVRLISLAILNESVSKHNHKLLVDMFQNWEEQRTVRLSRPFEEILNEKLTIRTNCQKDKEHASRCKLPQEICNACPDVDWSDWNTILAGTDTCLTKIRNYCSNVDIDEEMDYKGTADKNLCKLIYIPPPKLTFANTSPGNSSGKPSHVRHGAQKRHSSGNQYHPPHTHPIVITTSGHETVDLGKYDFNQVSEEILNKPVGNLNKNDILKIVRSLSKSDKHTEQHEHEANDLPRMYAKIQKEYEHTTSSTTSTTPQQYSSELSHIIDSSNADDLPNLYTKLQKDYENTSRTNTSTNTTPQKNTQQTTPSTLQNANETAPSPQQHATDKTDNNYGTDTYNRIIQQYEETIKATSRKPASSQESETKNDKNSSSSFLSSVWNWFGK